MNPWDSMPEEWKRVFAKKVRLEGECWMFTPRARRGGYGSIWYGGRHCISHRVSYVLAGRVIPEALVLDHLCHQRLCVRPDHLEPVTVMENGRREGLRRPPRPRRTHCKAGHELTDANTYIDPDRVRRCRACRRANDRRRYAKHRRVRPRRTRYNPNQGRLFE
jgi:hypothetical protein